MGSLILVGRYAGCEICVDEATEGRWIQIRRTVPGEPNFACLVVLEMREGSDRYEVRFADGLAFDRREVVRLIEHWDAWGFVEDGVLIDRHGIEQAATRSRLSK